jgi:hypothetical protein
LGWSVWAVQLAKAESIDAEGKGRVIFEEVDDLIGEQISVSAAPRWPEVAEEH